VTDEALVARAQAGDRDAFAALIDRHRTAIVRATYAVIGEHAAAEDAAQDACVSAWKALGSFRGEATFKSWLLRVAWRHALSQRRGWTRWWRSLVVFSDQPEAGQVSVMRSPADREPLADDIAAGRSELTLVQQVVASLPDRLRHPLLLAAGGLGMAEIADLLRLPVGTVKWRISEARRIAKEKMARRLERGATR